MDIIDDVSYRWEVNDSHSPERTRQAYNNVFDIGSEDSRLVMRHIIQHCKWLDQTEYNDPVIEAKMNSLRGLVLEMKKQLNMKPIGEEEYE